MITELARINGTAYGVKFTVCRNAEVAGLALEVESDDALAKMNHAGRAISDAGFDYEFCSDFRAYNGGPRKSIVEAVFYTADVIQTEGEADELDDWKATWQRGAGATEIPASVLAQADEVVSAAFAAMK